MPPEYLILLILAIPLLILGIYKEIRKYKQTQRLVTFIEKSQHDTMYFKIFQVPVGHLKIEQFEGGKKKLYLTATSLKQQHENYFIIGCKAIVNTHKIGFNIILANEIFIAHTNHEGQAEDFAYGLVIFDTQSEASDHFLRTLAEVLEVELSNKHQIKREAPFFTQEYSINIDNIFTRKEYILFLPTKEDSFTQPTIKLIVDLKNLEIILEETDIVFRPLIIDNLLFKKNVLNT